MSRLSRLFRSVRTTATGLPGALRARPRTAAAGLTLVVLLALVAGGSLVAISGQPPAAPVAATTDPTFTFRDGWTLVELQRHVEAGEVAAISGVKGNGTAGQPDHLVAKTNDGQLVPIDLSVSAGQAISAFTALGYGDLLTTEAVELRRPIAGEAGLSPLSLILPLSMLVLLIVFVLRLARSASRGHKDTSTFKTIMPTAAAADGTLPANADPGTAASIRLDDVAGCDEAKLELTETIEFLRTPERFHKMGARIPRGIMLYGPPGTGKTMLARAVAAEAGVPFHHASGSEFVEKYVGVGARRIRDLFAQARKLGRGVIFFDEFDALAKARGGPNSHEEREQTLNQLLVELDGFGTTDDVIVIAATNRLDTLDSAVLRPGRFNRKIHVGLPDVKGRREILAVHARNKPIATTVDLADTARKTYGFSGAMLADLLNEAAIFAARRHVEEIGPEEIHGGWLKVAVGTSRRRSMDERERSIIAAHEVGHAICGKIHGDKRKVEEISLFAHGEALGVTVSSQEDNDLPSESDLRARLIALMGGRAAEELLFQEVTGGASNDFEAANKIATAMVTKWGMGRDPEASDHGISGRGSLSFLVPAPGGRSLPTDVQAAATRAIRSILDEAYAEASRTLVEHMTTLRRLAAYLVEHERVDGDTFDELFDGRRPVANASDEWRAATARPRAWGEIVDLAAHRVRPVPVIVPTAAVVATGHPVVPIDPAPDVPAAPPPAPPVMSADDPLASGERPFRVRRRPSLGRRAVASLASPFVSRRTRHAAAGALHRAESWLRQTEPERGEL
ncbi:MAG TPA: AAA family ATPase [Candidatus Limnocylindrales bacterium]|nr:AAA family ATPase [Candidatus Limnocylindrales bacterium]